jgi:NAD(P)-dependent dehydrogenase (short-subunit alcohol dehydrogenase family)
MTNPLDLTGRIILVTGASSGIGRAVAVLVSQLGANVILIGRNEIRLGETLASLERRRHRIMVFDLSSTTGLSDCLKEVVLSTGPIHGFVHCAGIQMLGPLKMQHDEDIDRIMKVNVTAAIALSRSLRERTMHANGASFVFVSSIMGMVGAAGRSTYSASKGAIISFTRSLALEVVRDGIRVNCVAPGYVRTPMLDEVSSIVGAGQIQRIAASHPLGIGAPSDVANAVAFLLADTARWITGTTLVVDGGYTAQ